MKVILLAGGLGTRLSELTEALPKPMVPIGNRPILWHIMCHYAKYGHKDFYVATGYKSHIIKDYFLNYRTLNSDFTVDLGSGSIKPHKVEDIDWRVTLIDSGLDTMTGGRVKRMRKYIGTEPVMVTYGDGLSNINLSKLLAFHNQHGKLVTVTAVRPPARFGELGLDGDQVNKFEEKPQLQDGWINGGYFVFEPEFFDFIEGDNTLLEREPLEYVANTGELMAYKHDGFWHCMDTKRDHELLNALWEQDAPWNN